MIEFQVEGMSCQHCVAAVTKAVKAIDADARVQVELQSGRVLVESTGDARQLGDAIAEAGYTVKRAGPGGQADARDR
jgi:copper chaperone